MEALIVLFFHWHIASISSLVRKSALIFDPSLNPWYHNMMMTTTYESFLLPTMLFILKWPKFTKCVIKLCFHKVDSVIKTSNFGAVRFYCNGPSLIQLERLMEFRLFGKYIIHHWFGGRCDTYLKAQVYSVKVPFHEFLWSENKCTH